MSHDILGLTDTTENRTVWLMYTQRSFAAKEFREGWSTVANMRGWTWNAAGEIWRCAGSLDAVQVSVCLGYLATVAEVLSDKTNSSEVVHKQTLLRDVDKSLWFVYRSEQSGPLGTGVSPEDYYAGVRYAVEELGMQDLRTELPYISDSQ